MTSKCPNWVEFTDDEGNGGLAFMCKKPAKHRGRHECIEKADSRGPCPSAQVTVTWEGK